MYCFWKELDIWPIKELVNAYMPSDFKRLYASNRVIVDGVEVQIKTRKTNSTGSNVL